MSPRLDPQRAKMVSRALAPPLHEDVDVPSHEHGPGNLTVMSSAAQTRLELYRTTYLIRQVEEVLMTILSGG